MLVDRLILGDLDRFVEILVTQLRIDDLMAVLRQIGRLDVARDRLPAVQEENYHEGIVFEGSHGA
jgi:hypothetical protein